MLEGSIDGPVYRLGPRLPGHGVVAPYSGGEILFGDGLTRYDIGHRYAGGAGSRTGPRTGDPGGHDLLFLVRADGKLNPVTLVSPAPEEGTP